MNDEKDQRSEISVGPDGLTVSGPVADDLRAPLRRIAKTADSVLRLLDNIVGLPTDYVSLHLERFRDKYSEELEKIPEDCRQQPSLRVGCSVLRHVAYAAEEPELQEMFARLLAAASDSEKASLVHPGFATVINDLKSEDARLLVEMSRLSYSFPPTSHGVKELGASIGVADVGLVSRGLSNLLRLGLIEWEINVTQPSSTDLGRIAGTTHYWQPRDIKEAQRTMMEAIKDLQNVKNSVISAFRRQRTDQRLRVTGFGRQFLRACIPESNDLHQEDQDDAATEGLRAEEK